MQNETHFLDVDGAWKTFVYRGSMYSELAATLAEPSARIGWRSRIAGHRHSSALVFHGSQAR